MAKYLIVYGTKEGQTAKVAQHIADVIKQEGRTTDMYDVRKAPASLTIDGYTGVLIGSSIHYGQWSSDVRTFVRNNKSHIEAVPSAFFTVSLTAAKKDPEGATLANEWAQKFLDSTGWHPRTTVNFAGCLAYTKYGFCTKILMRCIASSQHQPTDTTKDHEFTNWNQVAEFAKTFVREAEESPPRQA